jgi:hypothetical protein
MGEAKEGTTASSNEVLPVEAHAHQPTIKEMLGELSFLEWIRAVQSGLRMPKNSGEYKYALWQVRRLWSPVCGVLLPLVLIVIVMLSPESTVSEFNAIPVTIEAQKATDVLKDDQTNKEPEPVEPPPPDDTTISPDAGAPSELPGAPGPATPTAGPSTPFSPQPAAFDSVAMIKSPITMKGVYASRSPGARGSNYGKGGYGGGGGGGGPITEAAVLRALRYLKKNQQPDGSWNKNKAAMTGLVILTYLAHGETPSDSKEFGATVQKAIEYLINVQNKTTGRIPGNYDPPIATYALCEAYGMTLNPNVKVAAEKAVELIIKGQHPTGGWTYNLDPAVNKEDGKYRDDTSYMGWCAQALKAAKMSDVYSDKEALDKAIKLAVRGFKKNSNPNGGFGYVGPGATGLSSVGTLCMQLLGASNDSEVKKTLDLMDAWVLDWEKPTFAEGSPQYFFYYATQAKFHSGGKRWDNWNKVMWPCYVKNQKITPKAIADMDGKLQDIGWWENTDKHTDRPVMDTCLTALQLMVYYRYLPTHQTAKAVTDDSGVLAVGTETKGDIKVDTGNL